MLTDTVPANPFAMLLDPEAALAAIHRSERLARLQSRVCRPLDRPVPASAGMRASDIDASEFGGLDDAN